MAQNRFLTKSRFQLATECPAKLFYTGKEAYADQKMEDSFLEALAEGGFQVGALAKCYLPGGHEIGSRNYDESLSETNDLLKQENVTIYEAAVSAGNFFIRADILVKTGNRLDLYEVKAKSFDPSEEHPFSTKSGTIKNAWKSYLYDAAFQKHVISRAFPQYKVKAHLMMADKSARCPSEKLNQKFRLQKGDEDRKSVVVSDTLGENDLNPPVLCQVNVDAECENIYAGTDTREPSPHSFAEKIQMYAEHYAADRKIQSPVSTACRECEFRTSAQDEREGLRSGVKECWKNQLGWSEADLSCATVLDIWNYRQKAKLIDAGTIKLSDVSEDDISPKTDNNPGLSTSERQWLQVRKYQAGDDTPWIDGSGLMRELNTWVFPLHFIDFETTMVAIPFNRGRHPYEAIAFQFSHHVVYDDGTVEHRGEYLNAEPGVFPNYEFLRRLMAELSGDRGTVFQYATHENTFLNHIYRQLQSDASEIEDRNALCAFIRTITRSRRESEEQWVGERAMVDMLEIGKRYYYDPLTKGSNSLKKVLPAVLNKSDFLKKKYSQPIYGAPGGITSLNFKDWRWITFDGEKVIDPYEQLPDMFRNPPEDAPPRLSEDSQLREGGAALTAYARMQFQEMSDYERGEIEQALLRYCELDTMAMVMLYEGWKDLVK